MIKIDENTLEIDGEKDQIIAELVILFTQAVKDDQLQKLLDIAMEISEMYLSGKLGKDYEQWLKERGAQA